VAIDQRMNGRGNGTQQGSNVWWKGQRPRCVGDAARAHGDAGARYRHSDGARRDTRLAPYTRRSNIHRLRATLGFQRTSICELTTRCNHRCYVLVQDVRNAGLG
jgi:hypothetical protein